MPYEAIGMLMIVAIMLFSPITTWLPALLGGSRTRLPTHLLPGPSLAGLARLHERAVLIVAAP